MTPADELKVLAALALRVLDQQQKYFRGKSRDDLTTSKKLEGLLRARCKEIVDLEGKLI